MDRLMPKESSRVDGNEHDGSLHDAKTRIEIPDCDGQPSVGQHAQFKWIVTIKAGLETLFRYNPDVFVVGDLLWYAEEGKPKVRTAPDAMVAFGRPKGNRGSYKQWVEGGIPRRSFSTCSLPATGTSTLSVSPDLRAIRRRGVLCSNPDNG